MTRRLRTALALAGALTIVVGSVVLFAERSAPTTRAVRADRGDILHAVDRPTRAPTTSVVGVVRDRVEAIVGARVCAVVWRAPPGDPGEPTCRRTGDGGRFVIALPAGAYRLVADAAGYAPATYRSEDTGTRLDLRAGAAASVTFTLAVGAQVVGTVHDLSGGPLSGAELELLGAQGWGPIRASTNDEGYFELWSAPGPLRLRATADGYAPAVFGGHAPGEPVAIVLAPESSLAGRVRRAEGGAPVPGVSIIALPRGLDGQVARSARPTDNEGSFVIGGLTPGAYEVYGTGAGWATRERALVQVPPFSQVAVELVARPAPEVRGHVLTMDGAPCPTSMVFLRGPGGIHVAQAGADGEVWFGAVAPGDYEVAVDCPGAAPAPDYGPLVVPIGTAVVEAGPWRVRSGARIRGRVLDDAGQPVGRIAAQVFQNNGTPDAITSASVDADGRFVIEGLQPGRYAVAAHSWEGDRLGEAVVAVLAESGDVELTLEIPRQAELRLSVVEHDGPAARGVRVVVLGETVGERDALAIGDGDHVAADLPAGEYRWAVVDPWGGPLRTTGPDAVRVELGEVARVHLSIEPRDATISGVVLDEHGGAVPDSLVSATREDGPSSEIAWRDSTMTFTTPRPPALTDNAGRFVLHRLPHGEYRVRATAIGLGVGEATVRAGERASEIRVHDGPN